jgi:hypothetical protein
MTRDNPREPFDVQLYVLILVGDTKEIGESVRKDAAERAEGGAYLPYIVNEIP